jgi:hypothetical protein
VSISSAGVAVGENLEDSVPEPWSLSNSPIPRLDLVTNLL